MKKTIEARLEKLEQAEGQGQGLILLLDWLPEEAATLPDDGRDRIVVSFVDPNDGHTREPRPFEELQRLYGEELAKKTRGST